MLCFSAVLSSCSIRFVHPLVSEFEFIFKSIHSFEFNLMVLLVVPTPGRIELVSDMEFEAELRRWGAWSELVSFIQKSYFNFCLSWTLGSLHALFIATKNLLMVLLPSFKHETISFQGNYSPSHRNNVEMYYCLMGLVRFLHQNVMLRRQLLKLKN